jgi:ABC-type Na+ transport system ATPase subunit NatA
MIAVVDLTTCYGNLPVLREVAFQVNKGKIYALVLAENKTYSIADEFLNTMKQYLREPQECHVQAT